MMVWPDSSRWVTRNDGSSRARAIQCDAHLLLVGLGLRLDRDLDHRLGEFHPLEDDRSILRAQGIAGGGVLETRQGDDVAGNRRP